MLLSIISTSSPATDLGYLLFKNPARVHGFDLSFGKATVFYPEATTERCTVCLLLEVDPIGMVRRKSGPAGDGGIFGQYVNDRLAQFINCDSSTRIIFRRHYLSLSSSTEIQFAMQSAPLTACGYIDAKSPFPCIAVFNVDRRAPNRSDLLTEAGAVGRCVKCQDADCRR
jgi:hypothetical protein